MSVYRKQVIGLSTILSLLIVSEGVNSLALMKVRSELVGKIRQFQAVKSEAEKVMRDLVEARLNFDQVITSGDTSAVRQIAVLMDGSANSADKIQALLPLEEYAGPARDIGEMSRKYVEDIRGAASSLQSESRRTGRTFVNLVSTDPVVKQKMDICASNIGKMMTSAQLVVEKASGAAAMSINDVSDASTFALQAGLALVFLAVAAGFATVLILNRKFKRPLQMLSGAAKQIASGNTEITADIPGGDELGELASSFNTTVMNFKRTYDELKKKSLAGEELARESKMAKVQAEAEQWYLGDSIEVMLREIDKFKAGDLTVSLTPQKDDEIKRLYEGFNEAVLNIENMIKEVMFAVENTASAATQINSSAEELATGVQEQSSQTEEVASAVEEMTRTIVDNSTNATKTAEVAQSSGRVAKEGGEVVKQTIVKIREIAEVVSTSSTTVRKLGDSSEQIGEIILVINDIADQTNLLALNAAIEAARAGEQGRGFAVVADEVRKLAERTTGATKQIGSMIKMVQSETMEAVKSMDRGTREIEEGISLADKAGVALENIVAETKHLIDMINQIAAAGEEQSSTSEQISKSVEGISTVTSQSAAGISQIARSADDLNRLTESLRTLISKFAIHHAAADGRSGNGKAGNSESALGRFDFEEAKRAHRMWRIRLANCIAGKEQIDEKVAGAYTECVLGKWYYNTAGKDLKGIAAYEELGKWHVELHQKAAEIVRLCNTNSVEEAESLLSSVGESSKHIINLLDQLEERSAVRT